MPQTSHSQSPSYEALLEKLYTLSRGKSTLSLEPMRALNQMAGGPINNLRTIHVAGTNGKGSVTTKIARALTLAGYKVGCYTSPHISCFRERIRINEAMISQEELRILLPPLMQQADKKQLPYSFFEITTLLAFCFFAKNQVDVAVIETGLGGRLDATNIIHPILSVITSISLDHTALLGTTLDAIAQEKGGIIKLGVPVVLGPRAQLPILLEKAHALEAPVHLAPATETDYDAENSAIAKTALHVLKEMGWVLSEHAIEKGLAKRPACRMEEVSAPAVTAAPIILDVAHNPDGIEKLLEALRLRYPDKPIYLLAGFCSDKDVAPMLKSLLERAVGVTFSQARHPRALSALRLLHQAQTLKPDKPLEARADLKEAFLLALKCAAQKNALLLICGSFFIMSEVRALLGFNEECDPILIYETVKRE